MIADDCHDPADHSAQPDRAQGQDGCTPKWRPAAAGNKRQRASFDGPGRAETDKRFKQHDAGPDVQDVEAGVAAAALEAGTALRHQAPSWCDRPLMTRADYPEDAQIDAFCYLPGHPLLALAAEGQAALLRKVLEQGADPDAQDSRKFTGWSGSPCCLASLRCPQTVAAAAQHTTLLIPHAVSTCSTAFGLP